MPIDGIPALVDSTEAASYEIVDDDAILRLVQEHEPSIPLSAQLLNAGSRLRGKRMCIPHYGAGFFMDGRWFRNVWLPRVNLENYRQVMYMLRRDPELEGLLHLTTRVIYYHDRAGCAFLSLCSNLSMYKRRDWFSRREKVLDAICKAMKFDETETAQAKRAFAWHMIEPTCYNVVPQEYIVGTYVE